MNILLVIFFFNVDQSSFAYTQLIGFISYTKFYLHTVMGFQMPTIQFLL